MTAGGDGEGRSRLPRFEVRERDYFFLYIISLLISRYKKLGCSFHNDVNKTYSQN